MSEPILRREETPRPLVAHQWEPIETHDGIQSPVLAAEQDGTVVEAWFNDDRQAWWELNSCDDGSPGSDRRVYPTHWMPLPPPPDTLGVSAAAAPATPEQEYQAALEALPDSLGRPLTRRIELVLERLRSESHIGCELRRELDGGIERDAKAIEDQWPEAAKFLRSHAHIEDGV